MVGAAQFSAGVICAAAAGALWGATFAVPLLLPGFSPFEITAARFAFFGLASLIIMLARGRTQLRAAPLSVWREALFLTLAGNVGYYVLLILAIRYAGPALPTLIIGTLPVTMALAANLRNRETSFGQLLPPLVPIFAGLLLVNAKQADLIDVHDPERWLGAACAVGALLLWTWYGVRNAEFLQAEGRNLASHWASMIGIATLPALVLLLPLPMLGGDEHLNAARPWVRFIGLTAFMGIGSSWAATWLWNRASALLPTALAGQLIVFETLFGLFFVYFVRSRYPADLELIGAGLLVIGVLWAIRRFEPEADPQALRALRKRKS